MSVLFSLFLLSLFLRFFFFSGALLFFLRVIINILVSLGDLVEGLFSTLSKLFPDETGSSDLCVKVFLFGDIRIKNRFALESKPELPVEEVLETFHIAVEVVSGLWVAGGDHLREINNSHVLFL